MGAVRACCALSLASARAGKPQHKVADRLRPDTQTIAREACGCVIDASRHSGFGGHLGPDLLRRPTDHEGLT